MTSSTRQEAPGPDRFGSRTELPITIQHQLVHTTPQARRRARRPLVLRHRSIDTTTAANSGADLPQIMLSPALAGAQAGLPRR